MKSLCEVTDGFFGAEEGCVVRSTLCTDLINGKSSPIMFLNGLQAISRQIASD